MATIELCNKYTQLCFNWLMNRYRTLLLATTETLASKLSNLLYSSGVPASQKVSKLISNIFGNLEIV